MMGALPMGLCCRPKALVWKQSSAPGSACANDILEVVVLLPVSLAVPNRRSVGAPCQGVGISPVEHGAGETYAD